MRSNEEVTGKINLIATAGEIPGEVDLKWKRVPGATAYAIQISRKRKNAAWSLIDIIDESYYTVSDLKENIEYCFRISVINSHGQEPWCESVTKKV